jgi:hypothetical protein
MERGSEHKAITNAGHCLRCVRHPFNVTNAAAQATLARQAEQLLPQLKVHAACARQHALLVHII